MDADALLKLSVESATVPPTLPFKIINPVPFAMVSDSVAAVVPLIVDAKVRLLLVVVNVVLAAKVTAPE